MVTQSPPAESPAATPAAEATSRPAAANTGRRERRPSKTVLSMNTPVIVRSTKFRGDRAGRVIRTEAPGQARVKVDLVTGVDTQLIANNGGNTTLDVMATAVDGFAAVEDLLGASDDVTAYFCVKDPGNGQGATRDAAPVNETNEILAGIGKAIESLTTRIAEISGELAKLSRRVADLEASKASDDEMRQSMLRSLHNHADQLRLIQGHSLLDAADQAKADATAAKDSKSGKASGTPPKRE